MEKELDKAINFCIEALNNRTDETRQEVEGNSDYVNATLQKIKQMPYHGRNLGIGDNHYDGFRNSFQDIINRFETKKITYSLDWKDALLVLFDFANYDEAKMLEFAKKIVNDNIIFNHVLKNIIANLVTLGNIKKAEEFIPNFKTTFIFKEEDNLDKGYFIILTHYAKLGDDKNFFKYFKLSKPAVNKYDVNVAKQYLVKNYATHNGIEQTIELCKHKNLGAKLYFSALTAFAEQGNYQELKQIFEKHPELKQPEAETELKILATAYLEAKKINLLIDDDFEELFERAVKMDRKLKWGDVKLQDSILLDLGLANQNNKERFLKCRKAIKNNWLKKELIIEVV